MTAEEKAHELLDKFNLPTGLMSIERKQCALIAVDEILEVIIFNKYDDKYWEEEEYWNAVKQELLKI